MSAAAIVAPPASYYRCCKRWRDGRARYRPAGELFDPSRASVALLAESDAKAFVCRHHYSKSYPAARFRFGLFWKPPFGAEYLAGVAVFGVPMTQFAIPKYFPGVVAAAGVELSRFVLLDAMKANAETWFIGQCFRALRRDRSDVPGILSYADPMSRTTADGLLVKAAHRGTIYLASNGRYCGRSSTRRLLLAPDGRAVSERALSKLRNEEKGHDYAYRQLLAMGAPRRDPGETGASYVARALAGGGFRRIPHPGNLVYAWWLGDRRESPLASQRVLVLESGSVKCD